MTNPATTAMGPSATPTQNTTQLPTIRPTPATMKAARATQTAVQAAGVLPWWAMGLLRSCGLCVGRQCSGSRRAARGVLRGVRVGRVAALVERRPEVLLTGRLRLSGRFAGTRRVVPAAHFWPRRGEPGGQEGGHQREDRADRSGPEPAGETLVLRATHQLCVGVGGVVGQ